MLYIFLLQAGAQVRARVFARYRVFDAAFEREGLLNRARLIPPFVQREAHATTIQ